MIIVTKIWKILTTSSHDNIIALYRIKFDKKLRTSLNDYPGHKYGHKRVDKVGKKTNIEIVTKE